MSDEYLVKVTIRNNLILRRMKELGIQTQMELARLSGLSQIAVSTLIRMKKRPVHKINGQWLDVAFALSSALQAEPEELWTVPQRSMALDSNSREISMCEDAVMQLASGDLIERNLITSKLVAEALATLSPREQEIIHARFFDGETFKEIGDRQGVSTTRIRQLEKKAIRKLKHPSRTKELRQLLQQGY